MTSREIAERAARKIAVRIGEAKTGDKLPLAVSALLRTWHAATEADVSEILADIIQAELPGWLPIELAPKAGSWQVVANFAHTKMRWWQRARFIRGCWRSEGGVCVPTHYLPLPPSKEAEDSGETPANG